MDIGVDHEYDATRNILFTVDRGEITSTSDIETFFSCYDRILAEIGRKVWVVANIDHLLVRSEVADEYGAKARATVSAKVLGVVRWGTDTWARMTVHTTSLKAGIPANIHPTRDEAIAAVEAAQRAAPTAR